MSLKIDKVKSYFGFALKSRNVVFGTDDIVSNKKVKLILLAEDISENSLKKLTKFSNMVSVLMIKLTKDEFFELTQKENVKVVAILDLSLALAIKKNLT